MEAINNIEKIIKHRRELDGTVQSAKSTITTVEKEGCALVSGPRNSNMIKIPASVMLPVMEYQLELLQLELAAIDKQLEALGALRGAGQ
jgi:hypothetical protein